MFTLTGVKGASIPTASHFVNGGSEIDRDVLLLPESVIDDLTTDATQFLRPLFDLVWNAAGFARSYNFDEGGKWVGS